MQHRGKTLLSFSVAACVGTGLFVGTAAWLAWRESIAAEEADVAQLARALGERTEATIVRAQDLLRDLDASELEPCSSAQLAAMDRVAFTEREILAIGYWQASERKCGAGLIQAIKLKPPAADRIYDSGIIAWWPGPQTEVEGVQLFLMRFGRFDVALDPRVLLRAVPTQGRQIGLWVENLPMAALPSDAHLPTPGSLSPGLRVDHAAGRLLTRFSLGTRVPIDVVIADPIDRVWRRHASTIAIIVGVLLVVSAMWLYTMLLHMRRRLSLAAELSWSLGNGGVFALYQPIIDLTTGRSVGAEALVRWRRDSGEVMPPSAFLGVAQDAGLMRRLTLAVLDATLADLAPFLRSEPGARINLNLAPEDLANTDFSDELARRLGEKRVPVASIKLEITERALLGSETARMIALLREQGHEVAVDDFGTGYSSLSYLQTFDLDTLKIDKAFVDTIGTEAVTSPVVHHVIELAQELKLSIVAEGVETEEQAVWLRSRGVDCAQGYLFNRPLTAQAFEEDFRARQGGKTCELRLVPEPAGREAR